MHILKSTFEFEIDGIFFFFLRKIAMAHPYVIHPLLLNIQEMSSHYASILRQSENYI